MAYQGQNKGQGNQNNSYVKRDSGSTGGGSKPGYDPTKPKLSLFKVFKNKGKGYSTVLKEAVTIPSGTRIGVFEDTLTGKDGTEYQVLNIKKMPDRPQA